jgi:hypothetical protein
VLLLIGSASQATIINVIEINLGGDAPAVIATNFGEDTLAYSDRTHEHNGAAFDATGTLTTPTGPNIVELPSYLLGGDYIRFANDTRDNDGYSATVFADTNMEWYLRIDNRLDGPAGDWKSLNTTDPVLGGTLQWVLDTNWERVNTGLSPNGQGDYTAADEGGDAVGAGQGLDQFFSVFKFPVAIDQITILTTGIKASNMITLIAVPEPSTLSLTALSLAALSAARRKKKRR